MEKILLILVLISVSCRQRDTLDFSTVTGQYSSLDTASYYTGVLLRGDSTYITDQFPGEFHLQNMGQWTIQGDTILLFKGKEFSDSLSIEEVKDTKSEALTINVADLQSKLGNQLRFSINNTDLQVTDGKITINKADFWKEDYSKGDYEYAPVNLDIRIKNSFARVQYIFTANVLDIKFRELPTFDFNPDSLLCKYYKLDSVLCSIDESYEIEKNTLIKNE